MIKIIILLLLVVGCIKISGFSIQEHGRIVGGTLASPNQFPYMTAILNTCDNTLRCGAALVGSRHVLSSAGCVTTNLIDFYVCVGSSNLQDCIAYRVENVLAHELYNPTTKAFDIALIRTKSCVHFDVTVRPVLTSFVTIPASTTCVFTGWGSQSSSPLIYDYNLDYINLNIVSSATCISQLNATMPFNDIYQICSSTSSTSTPCDKDLGGPLVCSGLLVGILSYSNCIGSPAVAVFTQPSSFVPWIASHIY